MNFFLRKVNKYRTDARTALVSDLWYGSAVVVGKGKKNVFVSYRARVAGVAPKMPPKGKRRRTLELGHHDERESLVRNGTR